MNTLSVKLDLTKVSASQAGIDLDNINQYIKKMVALFS